MTKIEDKKFRKSKIQYFQVSRDLIFTDSFKSKFFQSFEELIMSVPQHRKTRYSMTSIKKMKLQIGKIPNPCKTTWQNSTQLNKMSYKNSKMVQFPNTVSSTNKQKEKNYTCS